MTQPNVRNLSASYINRLPLGILHCARVAETQCGRAVSVKSLAQLSGVFPIAWHVRSLTSVKPNDPVLVVRTHEGLILCDSLCTAESLPRAHLVDQQGVILSPTTRALKFQCGETQLSLHAHKPSQWKSRHAIEFEAGEIAMKGKDHLKLQSACIYLN